MRKQLLILLAAVVCLLSGCERKERSGPWENALDRLKRKENYTVSETVQSADSITNRLAQYDRTSAKIVDGEDTTYYSRDGENCFIYILNDDPVIWVKKELPQSELYFYDYQLMERLNKISGYIDMGLLTYDEGKERYYGENLGKQYVYQGEAHAPNYLEIQIENGEIVMIRESWTGFADEEQTRQCVKISETVIGDFSATEVRLPLDVLNYEEVAENAENSEE